MPAPASPSGRLQVTAAARSALATLRHDRGPQVLYVSWPGGATVLPDGVFAPGPYEAIIGHVARCPVYADVRAVNHSATDTVTLDVAPGGAGSYPVMVLDPLDGAA